MAAKKNEDEFKFKGIFEFDDEHGFTWKIYDGDLSIEPPKEMEKEEGKKNARLYR